ncbi:hypothetical protein LSTR_LSTR010648 [Laodelphax striatellus]|uniref:Uncharacterized protein n=1 Tax=Laodelphax striatellus TaxID=195883 RepID=A0A482XQY6_LAOST|nr:hypothetical protein LSTR_LSTR010648 [Laodelphax striatellus]
MALDIEDRVTWTLIQHNNKIKLSLKVIDSIPILHNTSQGEKLCIFANSVCVFGICLLIGVFANSNVVLDPQSKRSHILYREAKSDRGK